MKSLEFIITKTRKKSLLCCLSASSETRGQPIAQHTAKSLLPRATCCPLIQTTQLCKITPRNRRRCHTYKIVLDFLKLHPQLPQPDGQQLGGVRAAGLQAVGRQGASSQQQQQGLAAGLHPGVFILLLPLVGCHWRAKHSSAGFTLMEPLIYTLKASQFPFPAS